MLIAHALGCTREYTFLSHYFTYDWVESKLAASSRSFRRGVVMLSLLVTAGADPMQVLHEHRHAHSLRNNWEGAGG